MVTMNPDPAIVTITTRKDVLSSYKEVHNLPGDTTAMRQATVRDAPILPGPGRFTPAEADAIRRESLAKRDEFTAYAIWWHYNTDALSSPTKKAADLAYGRIIAMGRSVLPLILSDLRDRGGYWFPALKEIVQWSPLTEKSPYGMAYAKRAWLDWGAEQGFVE